MKRIFVSKIKNKDLFKIFNLLLRIFFASLSDFLQNF